MKPLASLLLIAVIILGVSSQCHPSWTFSQGNCYRYGEKAASWHDAQIMCQTRDAKLAQVSSAQENNFLTSMARQNNVVRREDVTQGPFDYLLAYSVVYLGDIDNTPSQIECAWGALPFGVDGITANNDTTANCVWLGGSDIFHEGTWEWASTSNTFNGFSNWANGEPNNGLDGEDCLSLYRPQNYAWNDVPCTTGCNFICSTPSNDTDVTNKDGEC